MVIERLFLFIRWSIKQVEWGMVPYVQAMLLARYLRGDLDSYPVFLWK